MFSNSAYQYAMNLTPQLKKIRQKKRVTITQDGIYRINVYQSKSVVKTPKRINHTPDLHLRYFDSNYAFNAKQDQGSPYLPDIQNNRRFKSTMSRIRKSILEIKGRGHVKQPKIEKMVKDIALSTDD
jgi:hypothetical protein